VGQRLEQELRSRTANQRGRGHQPGLGRHV
jgi:hypothetical protein